MKTPTTTSASSSDKSTADKKAAAVKPEEVKDRVAVRYGFPSWHWLNLNYFGQYRESNDTKERARIRNQYIEIENEAMRDYASACAKAAADEAEALYTERIEKAGSELPDHHQVLLFIEDKLNYSVGAIETNDMLTLYLWIIEQASIAIAKKEEQIKNIISQCDLKIIIREKEIEELKEELSNQNNLINHYKRNLKY